MEKRKSRSLRKPRAPAEDTGGAATLQEFVVMEGVGLMQGVAVASKLNLAEDGVAETPVEEVAAPPVDAVVRTPQEKVAAAPAARAAAANGDASPGGPPRQIGTVDAISHEVISGWAWNPLKPEESVVVEIYDGNDLLIRVRAENFRKDLRNAGIGTGKYGFTVPQPSLLLPLAQHRIAVRRALDGVDLPGSPKWLLRPEAGFDFALTQFLESAALASAAVAQRPEDVDSQLALTLRVLNHLLNVRNTLNDNMALLGDVRLQDLLHEAEVTDWTRELIAKVETDFAPLQFDAAAAPLVSIVIPVYNKFRTTYNCLRSILDNLPNCSFEVIVVDDCSRDETLFAGFIVSGAIQVLRNPKNLGFVGSCNAGAARARGKYLLFLNNDTLLRPRWLDELVATFDNLPNIGIVGSKLFFEDGSLQEMGGIIWRLGDGWNWGRQGDPNDPRFCYLRDADYVSGAALMLERELFERLQGFDPHFAPGYYEDSDLCFRVRATGKRVVVQSASEVVHLEGVSSGKDVKGSGMKRFQVVNHRKFYERWRDTLSTHRFNGEQPELEAERSVRRRAYFIDDTVPTPDQDAGSNAALQHMLALIRLGYKVTFLPADNMAQINPYTANLQKLGIECLYAPYVWSVEEVFRKARIKPDLVYLHRFSNASKYANLVRQHFPGCFTVYNVADLHFLRQSREAVVEGSVAGGLKVGEEAELAAMRQVDSVIVHSSMEAQTLRERDPKLRVHVVRWTFPLRPCTAAFTDRAGYAFVGGYGHRPNVDAAKHLAHDIVPLVNDLQPALTGYLVGSKVPPDVTALETEHLKVLGFVPDLTPFLNRLRCTVAPLRYGAGLKGKILESFAHGLPCVMSEMAAEGVNLPAELQWLITRTPAEFAEKLVAVHDDELLNTQLAADGLEFVRRHYSDEATQRTLAEAITK